MTLLFQHGKQSENAVKNETNVSPGLLPNGMIASTFDTGEYYFILDQCVNLFLTCWMEKRLIWSTVSGAVRLAFRVFAECLVVAVCRRNICHRHICFFA